MNVESTTNMKEKDVLSKVTSLHPVMPFTHDSPSNAIAKLPMI